MGNLHLGLVQSNPIQGNIEANLQLMEDYIRQAGMNGKKVDMLVFPELFLTGYAPDLWEKRPTIEDEKSWHERLRQLCNEEELWLVYGHPSYKAQNRNFEIDKDKNNHHSGNYSDYPLYNAATMLSPEGIVGTYGKVHLFGDEVETFVSGNGFPIWQTPWGRVAIQICYDLEFPEAARVAALAGAELIIYPTANMSPFGEIHHTYVMSRALENGCFIAYNNRVGSESDLNFCGGSCVMTPNHRWLMNAETLQGLYMSTIDLTERLDLDTSLNYFEHRRPELYRLISDINTY